MLVGMFVGVGVRRGRRVDDQLDSPLLHAAHRQDPIGDDLQLVRLPFQDHDLQTEVVTQVNVHRRSHPVTELMLNLGQLLAEIAYVVVVDERQRPHCVDALGRLGPSDGGPPQIAKKLGARAPSLFHQNVELAQQGTLDRNTEPDQGVFHLARRY
jgi:hypothetical protein